jgi:hypothetical protein
MSRRHFLKLKFGPWIEAEGAGWGVAAAVVVVALVIGWRVMGGS